LNPFYKSFSAVAVAPEEPGALKGPSRLSIFNPDLLNNREVSKEQIEKFKQDNDIGSSMEISINTGENVEEIFLKISNMIINTGLIELKAGINEKQDEKLEKIREDFIWRIDRIMLSNNQKLLGARNLRKLKKVWRKKYPEGTVSFEKYINSHKRRIIQLAKYKKEIKNAKDATEVMNVWEKVKNILFIIDFS